MASSDGRVTVTVLAPFYDLVRKVDRTAGETFVVSEERGSQLASRLPSYVSISAADDTEADLSSLTVAQLRELCDARGVEAPKRAKKAELLTLLEG